MPKTLVIDDEESNRNLLAMILRKAGYEVILATLGQDAMRLMDVSVDLAFVDVHLPDVHGTAVIQSLRETSPDAIIVAATMDDNSDTIRAAYRAGCDVYLVKPFDLTELLTTLGQATKGKRWIIDRMGLREYIWMPGG